MLESLSPWRLAGAWSLAAAGLLAAAPARANLTFVFTDVGATPMTAQQLAGFQAAGAYWSSQFADNVTVYLDIQMAPLGSGVLGSTGSSQVSVSYAQLRNTLVADAKSSIDASAVAHLQPGSALAFLATQGDLSSRLDNDDTANNTFLFVSTANAKALGLNVGTSAAIPDARITFSKDFAFNYTRADGIDFNSYDFVTVAEHVIGHALGFISGVDGIDQCAGANNPCGLSNTVDRFENGPWYQPLDLFRYSAPGTLDLRVGGSPYFSVNGGATALMSLSTGSSAHGGNGWQASHFGPDALNLMRPYVVNGNAGTYDATAADLAAFDAIGWDLVTAVPEPATLTLFAMGLAAVGAFIRRQR